MWVCVMRLVVRNVWVSVMVAGTALLIASSAQADTWCRNGTLCIYSSYQQCASSIRIMGGSCTRERSPRYSAQPQQPRAFVGRSSYAQYSSSPLPTNLHPSKFSCSN
jgi:hypothetical protein